MGQVHKFNFSAVCARRLCKVSKFYLHENGNFSHFPIKSLPWRHLSYSNMANTRCCLTKSLPPFVEQKANFEVLLKTRKRVKFSSISIYNLSTEFHYKTSKYLHTRVYALYRILHTCKWCTKKEVISDNSQKKKIKKKFLDCNLYMLMKVTILFESVRYLCFLSSINIFYFQI